MVDDPDKREQSAASAPPTRAASGARDQWQTHGQAQLLLVLRRRWKIVLACVLITAAAAYGFSIARPNQYTAAAALLFQSSTLDQQVSGTSYFAPVTDPTRQASTNLTLASLGTISSLTATALRDGLSGAAVQAQVSVAAEGQSDVVSIAATDRDPTRAALVANTYANQYIRFSASSDRAKISQAQHMVQRQYDALPPALQASGQGQSLANRSEQLRILASLQTGDARLVQPATVPSSPSSPQPRRDGLLGVGVGLLLGLSLALLTDRLDRRLHSVDELAQVYDLPLLGVVPRDRSLGTSRGRGGVSADVSAEAFQLLRSRLRYFNVDRDIRMLVVTSSSAAEGKTTVAWNLAVATARAGEARVLLIEGDLRRPALVDYLDVGGSPGLVDVIARRVYFEDAVQTVDLDAGQVRAGVNRSNSNGTGTHAVDVLVAGPIAPNPAELLESREAHKLFMRLRDFYDQVIVDTAPMAIVSDAIPLISIADGLVVVSRLGKNSRDGARHMNAQLRQLHAPVLGVIANDVKTSADGY